MAKEKDTRYPYTYACDLIRSAAGYNEHGTKLSRSDASQIRTLIAEIIGMPDEELAKKLADYERQHCDELTEASVKEWKATQEYYKEKRK